MSFALVVAGGPCFALSVTQKNADKWWETLTTEEQEIFDFYTMFGMTETLPHFYSKEDWFSLADKCDKDIIEALEHGST